VTAEALLSYLAAELNKKSDRYITVYYMPIRIEISYWSLSQLAAADVQGFSRDVAS
jgi:hypothetical protein